MTLIWRGTHTGPYGGVAATGKPVEVRDTAIRHFRDGKVAEILTLQDQFGILKADRVPPGERPRRLTAGAGLLAEEGTSWIFA